MIARASKKADLNELAIKRQDYLEKNYAIFPKINKRGDQSEENLQENGFAGETFVNPTNTENDNP
jgi:hypothetical protein